MSLSIATRASLAIMTKPTISIVVAVTRTDAAVGKGGKLLFHISDDLKRFKALTLGHPVIMGRKTFESMGKLLPGRTNIVITRNPDYGTRGGLIAASLEDAVKKGSEIDNEIFVIGGGEIYKQALPITDKLYLTVVESSATGDVFFPDWRKDFSKETFREERFDEKTGLKYSWVDMIRE